MSEPQNTSDFVVIGRTGPAHGVKGWIKVTSFTEPRDNLLHYTPWHVRAGEGWRRYEVMAARQQGKALVVQLEGIEDRDEAVALKGREIAVPRDRLPGLDADEYYWADLIGLEVVTTDNVVLGRITQMMATGANDVMVVEQQNEQRLVPFVQPQFVKQVDLLNRRVSVDWDPDF